MRPDAVDVTDTVAVRIREAPWIDLVDNGVTPPGVVSHCYLFLVFSGHFSDET